LCSHDREGLAHYNYDEEVKQSKRVLHSNVVIIVSVTIFSYPPFFLITLRLFTHYGSLLPPRENTDFGVQRNHMQTVPYCAMSVQMGFGERLEVEIYDVIANI